MRDEIVALGARVHLFVRPDKREEFISLWRDVLNCNIAERDVGMEYPVALVVFPDGSSFSAEFSDLAPDEYSGDRLGDEHAFRGAWLEFKTHDVAAIEQKLRDSGIRHFRHAPSPHTYFSAPGGQVFRIIDVAYTGP